MFAISISYKNVPAKLREQYALSEEAGLALQAQLKEAGIRESVYLNTCNRCELYGVGEYRVGVRTFAAACGVEPSIVREYAKIYDGVEALRHLFRVTVGIESMVIGEDEILGQVKTAYERARVNGYTEYETHTVFQAAIGCSKKIKTETMLSKSSVSVATLAADRCHKFEKGNKKILIIGATGDTGKKIIQNLLSFGDCEILATVRREHSFTNQLTIVPYEERYQYVDAADIIISATKSPHYTLTYSKIMQEPLTQKPRLFMDLAIPRDIDEEVLRIPEAALITMDEIEELAAKNNALKMAEVEVAENMVTESLDEVQKVLAFHAFIPLFNQLKTNRPEQFAQFVYQYRDAATAEELESFIRVLRKLAQEEA